MFVVTYRETYSGTYEVPENEAQTEEKAKELVLQMIQEGKLDGPETCVGSSVSVVRVVDE